jgi:multiple sugar transport system substrate-binding protein
LATGARGLAATITTIALAIALIAGFAGCGGSSSSGGKVSLNWFVATQPGGTIQEVAKRCTDESNGRYEVNVELLPTDASQQREQLVRRLGAKDSTVDLIGMDVIWTAEFANAGWLREWTGPLKEQVTKGIFSSVIDTASFEGKLYGAPFNSNTQLLWYRTDLVKKPPTTWKQMIDEATQLHKYVQVQANRYEGYTVWVNAMIESAGGQILSGP